MFALGVMFLETLANQNINTYVKAQDVYTYARSYPLVKDLSGMLRNMLSKGRKLKAAKRSSNKYGNYGQKRYNYGGYGQGRFLEGNDTIDNKYISKDFNIFHVI